jgi:hypothetical protein
MFLFLKATERFITVANILIFALEYAVPKSSVNVLPDGEPPNVKIGLPSPLFPVKLITSPAPVEPRCHYRN